jgi:hypothetical protein
MLSSERDAEVCDATKDDSSTDDDKKILLISFCSYQPELLMSLI